MKNKNFIILVWGIITNFIFVFFASAQGVSLPSNVGLPNGSLVQVIYGFTNWLLRIFGFLAIISFIISGIMYFFAAGDEKQQEKAKKQMEWSIIGVVIGLIGLIIINTIDTLLRGGFSGFGFGMFGF